VPPKKKKIRGQYDMINIDGKTMTYKNFQAMAAKDVRDRIRSGEPVKKAEYILNQGDK
jgi:hypothetical protein